MTDTAPKMQALMDTAYARWQSAIGPGARGMSKDEFWATLSAQERRAVFTGNLNQQVTNGGFAQWVDNRYGVDEVFAYMIGLCIELKTPAALVVQNLLHAVNVARRDYEQSESDEAWRDFFSVTDGLSTAFYTVNEAFLADVENTL